MIDENYISAAEFAKKAGITVQAVYQAKNTKLKEYCKQVGKSWFVDESALKLYQSRKEADSQENTNFVELKALQESLKALQQENETLQASLKDLQTLLNAANLEKSALQAKANEQEKLIDELRQSKEQFAALAAALSQKVVPQIPEKTSFWKRIFKR